MAEHMDAAIDDAEEELPITLQRSVTLVSNPKAGKPSWMVGQLILQGGKEFVEMKMGDKFLSLWLIGTKAYNTQVSCVIKKLMDLQATASMASLGHEPTQASKSAYRMQKEAKRLRELESNVAPGTLVSLELPSFESNGMVGNGVSTCMPLACFPQWAQLRAATEELTWAWKWCQTVSKPLKRMAVKPPERGDDVKYWHKTKNVYVRRTVVGDTVKYKSVKTEIEQGGADVDECMEVSSADSDDMDELSHS